MSFIKKLKKSVRKVQYQIDLWRRMGEFKDKLSKAPSIKLIVGASTSSQEGWISTQKDELNLLDAQQWKSVLQDRKVDAILSEHVWEHLNLEEGKKAAQTCFQYVKPGGYMRVAVPDGYFPDAEYIDYVKPGGHGEGSDDHHVLYTYSMLKDVFESAGFKVNLLEYFDESGKFHGSEWDPQKGMIRRSARFDERNANGNLKYTSIIIDAQKH